MSANPSVVANEVASSEIPEDLSDRQLSDRFEQIEAPTPERAAPEGVPEREARAPEGETPPVETEKKPEEAPPETQEEGKEYANFEDWVRDTGVDPESVKTLPIKLTIDGVEREVPLKEVIDGYNLSTASLQRMERVATERRAFEQETTQVRQALGVRIQQAETLLQTAYQQVVADFEQLQGPAGRALNAENPQEFARLWNLYQQRAAQIQGSMQQVAQQTRQEAQASEQARQKAIQEGSAQLLSVRPEWKDPAKARAAQQAMHEYGLGRGFSDAELGNILDPRYLLVLDDAAKYAQLTGKKSTALKQVRSAPRVVKPGTRQVRDPQAGKIQAARDAWESSGRRDDDAAAALFELLG